MEPTENNKLAANELWKTWGDRPAIHRHLDAAEENDILIASLEDCPWEGVRAVGTISLSDHDLGMGPVRVELVGAFPATFERAADVAATCAFNAFKDGKPARPDAVHPRVLEMYMPETTTPHILLCDPFVWPLGPKTIKRDDYSIAWLMMMPITQAEWIFGDIHGPEALRSRLEKANADFLDFQRPSVV